MIEPLRQGGDHEKEADTSKLDDLRRYLEIGTEFFIRPSYWLREPASAILI